MRDSSPEFKSLREYRKGLSSLSPGEIEKLKFVDTGTCATDAFHEAGYNNVKFKPDIHLKDLIQYCNQFGLTIRKPNPQSDTRGVPLIIIYRVGHPEEHQLHAEFTENAPVLIMEGKQIIAVVDVPHR